MVHGIAVTMTTVQRVWGTSWYPMDDYVVPLIRNIMFRIPIIVPIDTVQVAYGQQEMTAVNDLNHITVSQILAVRSHFVITSRFVITVVAFCNNIFYQRENG
jgi:hypothetical protein